MTNVAKDFYDDDWMIAEDRPGYHVKKTVNRNADGSVRSYITSYRPILTDEERERRMKLIAAAATDLLLDIYETRAKEARKNA